MENQEFYKKILDHLSDGVYFVDRHRNIVYWNTGAEKISGYLAEQVVGHNCGNAILRHVDGEGRPLCQDGCPLAETIERWCNQRDAGVFPPCRGTPRPDGDTHFSCV